MYQTKYCPVSTWKWWQGSRGRDRDCDCDCDCDCERDWDWDWAWDWGIDLVRTTMAVVMAVVIATFVVEKMFDDELSDLMVCPVRLFIQLCTIFPV